MPEAPQVHVRRSDVVSKRGAEPLSEVRDRALQIAAEVRMCRRCDGMNVPGETEAAPAYGDPASRVAFVGQSLCRPCMATQIPFTGGSGRFLDQAFVLAGVSKVDVFITNVVHCHPPANRRSLPDEIKACAPFLMRELALAPRRLIVALGRDASAAVRVLYASECFLPADFTFESPVPLLDAGSTWVWEARHPSYILRQSSASRHAYVRQVANAIVWARQS